MWWTGRMPPEILFCFYFLCLQLTSELFELNVMTLPPFWKYPLICWLWMENSLTSTWYLLGLTEVIEHYLGKHFNSRSMFFRWITEQCWSFWNPGLLLSVGLAVTLTVGGVLHPLHPAVVQLCGCLANTDVTYISLIIFLSRRSALINQHNKIRSRDNSWSYSK